MTNHTAQFNTHIQQYRDYRPTIQDYKYTLFNCKVFQVMQIKDMNK